MQKTIALLVLSLAFFFSPLGALAADADVVKQAEELMRQGKPAEAYSILQPLIPRNAGNVDFDYLLGIAALDSGKPDDAINAFERVLAVNPTHLGARLDMGRAFFALGALDLAKQEFERVNAANPPDAARKVVAQYMAAIDERSKEQARRLSGYLEAGIGYDDNITSSTSTFQSGTQQAFGAAFNPTGNAIRRKAGFYTVGGGIDFLTPLTDIFFMTAGFDFKNRYFDPRSAPVEPAPRPVAGDVPRDNSAYDSQTIDMRVGGGVKLGRHTVSLTLRTQRYRQDGDTPLNPGQPRATSDRDTEALGGEWRFAVSAEGQIAAFAQYANNRIRTLDTQDSNQTLYGLSYLHAFQRPGNPVVFFSVFQSEDRALRPQNPPINSTDVSKTVQGVRLIGGYSVTERTDLSLSLGYSEREDDTAGSRSTQVPFVNDKTYEVGMGLTWRFAPLWSVRGMVQHTKNDSSLDLYSFKRTEASVTVRRDFR